MIVKWMILKIVDIVNSRLLREETIGTFNLIEKSEPEYKKALWQFKIGYYREIGSSYGIQKRVFVESLRL